MDIDILKEYEKELRKVYVNDERMVNYCLKTVSQIVVFENGSFLIISKPSIKTSFCFGYGWSGIPSIEDERRAEEERQHLLNSYEEFIEENLNELRHEEFYFLCSFDSLIDRKENNELIRLNYYWRDPNSRISEIRRHSREYEGSGQYLLQWEEEEKLVKDGVATYLTSKDIDALYNAYEVEKEKFIKRLNTYLKRYGTTKLNTWTFLVD